MTKSMPSRSGCLKTSRDEDRKQSRRALPKNLILHLPYRIAKESGFGDLLSRLQMHVSAQNGVDFGGGSSTKSQNLDWFGVCEVVVGQEFI
jgi:hypothetical protein